MKTKFFLFFISFFLATSVCNAQVNNLLNAAKKKASKTVEKRVEKETEKAVNKAIDKTVEKASEKLKKNEENEETEENEPSEEASTSTPKNKSSNQGSGGGILDLMNKYTGGENLVYENAYSFTAEVKYLVESVDENGETGKAYYRNLFATGSENMAMILEDAENETGNKASVIIFDQKNQVTIMINETEKSGMVMGLGGTEQTEQTENTEETENVEPEEGEEVSLNYKKTGKSKKVLGYTCYEYVSANEEFETTVWTTTELKFSGNTGLSRMNNMNSFYTAGVYPSGFVMEMTHINLKDNSKLVTTVQDFNESKSSKIDLSKYQLIKMGTNYNNQ
jgi:polyribonucleotide nucleotidyltransferase